MNAVPFGVPQIAWPAMAPGGGLVLPLLALALAAFLLTLTATATRTTWLPSLQRMGRRCHGPGDRRTPHPA